MGGYWIKKEAIPIKELPLSERRGMKGLPTFYPQRAGADREVLGSFFF